MLVKLLREIVFSWVKYGHVVVVAVGNVALNLEGLSLALSLTDSLVVGGTFAISLAASILVFWATRRYLESYAKKTPTKVDDVIVSILKGPVVFIVISYIAIFLVGSLTPSPSTSLRSSLGLSYDFVLLLFGTWIVAKVFTVVMHRAQTRALKTPTRVDDTIIQGATKTGNVLIAVVGVAIALSLLFLAIGLLGISTG